MEHVESVVQIEMNTMEFVALSTCHACCTIQWLCNMLSPTHFPLQLPPYEPCLCLIRGTVQIRLLLVYGYIAGRIIRSWFTSFII